jgi:PAS domain S-box-containing protein
MKNQNKILGNEINIKGKLKILFAEDLITDAELIWREISRNKIDFDKVLVDSEKEYRKALNDFAPDLIISDYSMPQFDGMTALVIRNEIASGIPFILATGSVNEEIAVEMMKAGADDYVIKQNLSRLGSAIRSALQKREIILRQEAAEKALKESEEHFRMLFEKAPVGYQSLDENGCFLEVNETWLSILGYERDDVTGKWFGDFLSSEYVDAFRERFPQFKEWGRIHSEFKMKKKDGSQIVASFEGRIAHYPDGKFRQTHCVLEDVTELRRAEATLHESEERFRRAVTDSPVPIMIHDEEGKVLLLSKGWTRYSGYTLDDIPFLSDWTEAAYGEKAGPKKEYIDNLFRINKTEDNGEWVIRTKDGDKRIWEFHTTPLGRVSEGKRVLHSLAIDITDQKRTEEELRNKIDELEKFNELTVGRELKMVELKKEVNEILKKYGEKEKYRIVE